MKLLAAVAVLGVALVANGEGDVEANNNNLLGVGLPDVDVTYDTEIIKTCKPGDPDTIVCDHRPKEYQEWVCDAITEFNHCHVVCEDSADEGATCVGYTFGNSRVECGGVGWEVCFRADFTHSEVTCNNTDLHGTFQDAACYGAKFTNSHVGCSSKFDCLSATVNASVVDCGGEQSCFGTSASGLEATFEKSVVTCSGPNSCGGSVTFKTSAVTCEAANNATACNSESIRLEECSCCDGEHCPSEGNVPSCKDPSFCSTVYLGKTCAEWGNPVCDFDSFLDTVGRQPYVEPPPSESSDEEEPTVEDKEPIREDLGSGADTYTPLQDEDGSSNALFALLGLLVIVPIMVCFCFNKKEPTAGTDSGDNVEEGNKPYDTASEVSAEI